MNRTSNWRSAYIVFILLAALLLLVGQWGAGVTTLVLTAALAQLVRIGNHLETLAGVLNEGSV
ncbi:MULTISPECIES: hypothetical protein [Deinococcus]|uniref:hypothetical protein n=1 Tax=Deinococcus TaxID=1298 RepID=UPI00105582B3|nr:MULTISPECIES: hypothetical protein [Deinococcus]TDE84992.1 hypothetical protein E0686_14210 [Deinococcus sp. S9]